MSIDNRGSHIRCDGPGSEGAGCPRYAHGPVALRPSPAQQSETSGWLFVETGEASRHFCPACAPQYVRRHIAGVDARGGAVIPGPAG